MAQIIKCPQCQAEIEDDSIFCDQCGQHLYVCPKCHKIGKGEGKCCSQCGTRLVPAGSQTAPPATPIGANNSPQTPSVPPASPAAPSASEPPAAPAQTPPTARPFMPQTPQPQAAAPRPSGTIIGNRELMGITQLHCKADGIVVALQSGAVIGRCTGPFANVLSTYGYISGTHARIDNTPTGWTITDLGSTNGTKVNGMRLKPQQPCPIKKGDVVRIAIHDFEVE